MDSEQVSFLQACYPRALFQKATPRLTASNVLTQGFTASKLPTSGLATDMILTPGDVQNSTPGLDPCGLLMSGIAIGMIQYLYAPAELPTPRLTAGKIPNAGLPQNSKPHELFHEGALTPDPKKVRYLIHGEH